MVTPGNQEIDPDALASMQRVASRLLRERGEPDLKAPAFSDLVRFREWCREEVITMSPVNLVQYALAMAFELLWPRHGMDLRGRIAMAERIIPAGADRSARRAALLVAVATLDVRDVVRHEGRPEEARAAAEACLWGFGWSSGQIAELTQPGNERTVKRRIERYLKRHQGAPGAVILRAECQGHETR